MLIANRDDNVFRSFENLLIHTDVVAVPVNTDPGLRRITSTPAIQPALWHTVVNTLILRQVTENPDSGLCLVIIVITGLRL